MPHPQSSTVCRLQVSVQAVSSARPFGNPEAWLGFLVTTPCSLSGLDRLSRTSGGVQGGPGYWEHFTGRSRRKTGQAGRPAGLHRAVEAWCLARSRWGDPQERFVGTKPRGCGHCPAQSCQPRTSGFSPTRGKHGEQKRPGVFPSYTQTSSTHNTQPPDSHGFLNDARGLVNREENTVEQLVVDLGGAE